MPWQNFTKLSSVPSFIVCTISALISSDFGSTSYPNFSKILLANIAVFTLDFTTCGAKNNPLSNWVFCPNDGPIAFAIPGAVILSAHNSIKSHLPTTFAPYGAIPAPKFFINDPTAISAPTSIGSLSCTNSP